MKKGKKEMFGILVLREMPAMVTAIMLIHVLLVLFGYKAYFAEVAEVCFGFFIIYVMSQHHHLCYLHTANVGYAYVVTLCMWWNRFTAGFGELLKPACVVLVIIGLVLFVLNTVYYLKLRRKINEVKNGKGEISGGSEALGNDWGCESLRYNRFHL